MLTKRRANARQRLPSSAMELRALLLDMDGTLTRPMLDFDAIRREIGLAMLRRRRS